MNFNKKKIRLDKFLNSRSIQEILYKYNNTHLCGQNTTYKLLRKYLKIYFTYLQNLKSGLSDKPDNVNYRKEILFI